MLGQVPRHQLIVASILGEKHSGVITTFIGISEIIMAIWILSRWKPVSATTLQVLAVVLMNIIECIAAPALLLFGRMNALLASFFVMFVILNGFLQSKHKA